ncbi:hypothetical protein C8J56DRAFT_724048, partial [Mycena floridula]
IQKMAKERSPQKRAAFIIHMGQYSPAQCFFLDETSKDDRIYARIWGRSPKGSRVQQHQPFVRRHRFSLVAGLVLDEGLSAVQVIEGSYTRETFMAFLANDVV